MEWKHPSIIALKGYPFTGKTSLSLDLACHLRLCLVLSLDDIVESITPAAYSPAGGARPPPAEAGELIAKAFDILCGQIEKQLSIGQSVMVDSLPLSRAHLGRLAGLSKAAKVVIVECQIERQYFWQMRFKKEYPDNKDDARAMAWYKPRDWEEVTRIVESYDGRLDEPIPGVSRLYLNVDENVRGRHVIQAIQTLLFCEDDRHVDYQKWSKYNLSIMHHYKYKDDDHDHTNCGHDHGHHGGEKELFNQRRIERSSRSCRDGHRISVFTGEGLAGYEADCMVCQDPVAGPAYACNSCQAALHKSCAEMRSAQTRSFTPQDFHTFIRESTTAADKHVYCFPGSFPCFHCREAGKEFSEECSGCIFQSLLRCRLVPTVIEHDGHAHKLSLWAMKIESKGDYTCAACGKEGAYAAYGCDGCETNYHVECALLPYPIKDHKHGGHQHTVELMFEREDKEDDDFPCSYCLENMSPEDWYYYCALCYQTYHLKCAFLHDA